MLHHASKVALSALVVMALPEPGKRSAFQGALPTA